MDTLLQRLWLPFNLINCLLNRLRPGSLIGVALLLGFVVSIPKSLAAPNPEAFPPNPLEITTPDPLLPQPNRPLDPQEQAQLTAALAELSLQAEAQLRAGNSTAAFDLWNRELRLRRALGPLEEVKALGRVGNIAWAENQTPQVQVITKRLQAIQQQAEAQPPVDFTLMEALGTAYQQVRSPGLALNVYDKILAQVRQQGDAAAEVSILNTIGQLHLSWFDYPKAAATYQELRTLAQGSNNYPQEIAHLQQLAYIYEQAKQPTEAIAIQQQLADRHQAAKDLEPIPALKLAIAANYQALGQLTEAEQNYKQAYTLAQPLQQFYNASKALQALGTLYRSQDQLDAALRVYQFLIAVEQQAYDFYSMMNTFDQIGQIHLARQDYPQALVAFQNGLKLAQQLRYQEVYFAQQIEQIQQTTNSPVN